MSPASCPSVQRRSPYSPSSSFGISPQGLVCAVAPGASRGGHPGVPLGLVGEVSPALGAKITQDRLTLVRQDPEGELAGFTDRLFDFGASNAPEALCATGQNLDALAAVADELTPACSESRWRATSYAPGRATARRRGPPGCQVQCGRGRDRRRRVWSTWRPCGRTERPRCGAGSDHGRRRLTLPAGTLRY